ncbi:MAG TPA: RNA polymerase sigma factor [Solirubrobacteraceae bacterium]|jgi:RNA polymerase sigma-70 factor (ECF subfamily)
MVISKPEHSQRSSSPVPRSGSRASSGSDRGQRRLDPDRLGDHIDRLYRAAWALCGSPYDAEDLVQETFLSVLKRPRLLRRDDDLGYLLRALRNTYANGHRRASRRPRTRELFDVDNPPSSESEFSAREIMEAIATAPAPFRDAVIAVDLLGLSYHEAARALRTQEATLTTRLHRGRQRIARALVN